MSARLKRKVDAPADHVPKAGATGEIAAVDAAFAANQAAAAIWAAVERIRTPHIAQAWAVIRYSVAPAEFASIARAVGWDADGESALRHGYREAGRLARVEKARASTERRERNGADETQRKPPPRWFRELYGEAKATKAAKTAKTPPPRIDESILFD